MSLPRGSPRWWSITSRPRSPASSATASRSSSPSRTWDSRSTWPIGSTCSRRGTSATTAPPPSSATTTRSVTNTSLSEVVPRRRPRGTPPGPIRLATDLGLLALQEAVVLLLRLLPRVSVALLQQADQLIGLALGPIQLVVGELAPLLLDPPLHLLPLAGKDVLVHRGSFLWRANVSSAELKLDAGKGQVVCRVDTRRFARSPLVFCANLAGRTFTRVRRSR